jgi:hypothetical protein
LPAAQTGRVQARDASHQCLASDPIFGGGEGVAMVAAESNRKLPVAGCIQANMHGQHRQQRRPQTTTAPMIGANDSDSRSISSTVTGACEERCWCALLVEARPETMMVAVVVRMVGVGKIGDGDEDGGGSDGVMKASDVLSCQHHWCL